ncbi:alpha/beta hydrolase [Natronococcus occultus]|uniref:Esterase/lipase n=1 Tax=Natronococcus occultus SP4 TaxID=694430 RepID=L0K5Y0_9EURY|nr:alpha/beta hydrolase [Natronococcus occultus]AGB39935.1 esterase/lipase [Natronococcus occultus SP4]
MSANPDPEMQTVLNALEEEQVPELNTLSIADARALLTEMFSFSDEEMDSVAAVENGTVPGRNGEIPVRTYIPHGEGPFPLFVYYHGGGWILGNLDTHDATCRALANATESVVASVEYGLAPESPFPGPVEDCYDATEYLATRADDFDSDADRLIVGGDSAGGNLAAAVALRARDIDGPSISHQVLVYPVTDHAFDTDSYAENASGYFITRADMEWFWDLYLPSDLDGGNPYASPLRARSLEELPSASVITAGFDPLRDEGVAYAERLAAAGVDVEHHSYDGSIHGFLSMLVEPAVPHARDAIDKINADLERTFE